MKRLINVFKLIIYPSGTWATIFQNSSHQMLERALFYPMIALYASSFFLAMLYDSSIDFAGVLTDALIGFVSYFIGYLLVAQILNIILPKFQEEDKSSSEGKIRTFVIYCMSILLIVDIVQNTLPTYLIVLLLFQAYILYVIDKAKKYFYIKETNVFYFDFVCFIFIFLVPIVIRYVFDIFLK